MRGDRAPNRRNRVGAWRKPGGQPPAKRHAAGRPATDRIVAVTINVDSLRGKVGCVLRAIDDLARRVGARVAVLVLEETKLEPGVEIQIPGFYPASRRDRDRHGGGVAIFVDGAYVAFESYKAPADGGVEAVEVTVLGAENDAACRFLGVYRPPGPGVAALATIDDRAAAAATAGIPLVVLGDLNVPRYDDARQAGVWARAAKRESNATPVARRLATISARHDLTVVSGLVAWSGPTERESATHFRPGAVPSELDFILADGDARALICGGGTDNGEASSWAFSHHRAVWVALSFEARRQPPPAPPRFPAARWRSADDAAREAYAADLDARLGDIVRALEAGDLGRWNGNVQAAVREIINHIHAAAARKVGLAGQARRFDPDPPWWNGAVKDAAARFARASAALSAAARRGDDASTTLAATDVRRRHAAFRRRVEAARASFFEWRLVAAKRNPRALSAVYDELRAHLGQKRARGGRGTAHVWRALRTPDGRLVSGDAIGAELTAQVTAAFGYDAQDPRFDADAAIALERGSRNIRCSDALAAECRAPTYANGGLDVTAGEVAEAKSTAKLGKVAHPDDGVVPEALVYGGPMLDRALAAVFTIVLRTGVVPADWRTGAMRCVYKKGDTCVFKNYRGVVCGSHVAKLFERVLLRRLLRVAEGVDEAQAVANAPVDCRCQLHLLYDILLAAPGTWLMAIDITRGFPSTSRELTVGALRRHGVGGRLLRAIVGLIHGTSVVVGLRPGVDTRRVKLLVGLLEGAVLSPALFAFACSGLLRALRESGLGVRLGQVHVPALMLMDDLVLLARNRGELRAMAAVVFEWCWKNRFVLALAEKSHILAPFPASRPDETRLVWAPPGGSGAAAIDVKFRHRGALTYLGFVVSRRGGPDAHIVRQAAIAGNVVDKMELEYGGRAAVTFNQALLLWTVHGRIHVEWPAAVLPPPLLQADGSGRPGWDATLMFEQKQQRALAAILGDSAGGVLSHQTILVVFGLWRIDERRILARASYAFVFSQTRRRPWRASIFAELRARVGRDPVFRKESVTGAIGAALKKLGLAWPRLEVPDGGATRDAPGETAVDSDDEDFVRLRRSRAEIEADARRWAAAAAAEAAAGPAGATGATGAGDGRDADVDERRPPRADGDGRASDDSDSETDGEERPDAGAAQRAWNADVRRRCVALVKTREAALFAKKKPPRDAEFEVKSAALWREIAEGTFETHPTGIQHIKLRYWMRTCVLSLTADAAGAALVATLCGCWWAAPTGRLRTPEGGFVPSVCGACGAQSGCLLLHLLTGQHGNEAECACPGARRCRHAWEAEVARLYAEHADAAATVAYAGAQLHSHRRLALMLGRARGIELPWPLASALPGAFVQTWGRWSARALRRRAAGAGTAGG